jgi:hypothetical protein
MAETRAISDYFTGEDKTITFTVYLRPSGLTDAEFAAQIAAGTASIQNITGWGLSWMVKKKAAESDARALIVKTVGNGITLTSPTTGVCDVALTDDDINGVIDGREKYVHELKRTDSGSETVLCQGTFILSQAVHQ